MNKWGTTIALVGVFGATLLTGCGNDRPPIALAVVLDTSGSAWENRGRGLEYLQNMLRGGYLPKGSTLALVRCGRDSKIVWDGRVVDSAEILAAYEEAVKYQEKGGGTDVVTALDLSREWLAAQREHGLRRTILTGWTDLEADPAKNGAHVVHAFAPVDAMTWPDCKGLQVVFFGVAPEQEAALKARWKPSLGSVTFYGPAHRIRPEDVGLTRGSTI